MAGMAFAMRASAAQAAGVRGRVGGPARRSGGAARVPGRRPATPAVSGRRDDRLVGE